VSSRRSPRGGLLVFLAALAVASRGAPAAEGSWELVVDAGLAGGGGVETAPPELDGRLETAWLAGFTGIRSLGPETALEIGWLRQRAPFEPQGPVAGVEPAAFDVDIDALDFAGTYRPARSGHRPYVSVSLGLLRVAPDAAGVDDDLSFSLGVAGGTTFALSPRLGLRLLARGRLILASTSFTGVCGSVGCRVELFTDGPFRLEGSVGLVIRPGASP
jgi:hypothetical protein